MRGHRQPPGATTRCAVYTRKSTDEGLEQEFNSLDAQREACEAYILSQRHEGWNLQPDQYDDGGYSGGSMERPGLLQLLADVRAGKVDVIVVYKVDRLTRSLADFAKIVEVLDEAGASFVSVTQAFNTTTSMGRLTLNVLLSFAQFEREVTSERIRDKVAASKKKGMWMGGAVPLGYEVRDKKLIVNEADAATVGHIFRRYVELGSTSLLSEALHREGVLTKVRSREGATSGGVAFSRGALTHLLKNRLYIGEVCHRGEAYPGQHDPIIDKGSWTRVQELLENNRRERRIGLRAEWPSLLAGMATDGLGRALSPSHASKGGRRYRYYVSQRVLDDQRPAWRLPAGDLELIALDLIASASVALTSDRSHSASDYCLLQQQVAAFRQRLTRASAPEQRRILMAVDTLVSIGESEVSISVNTSSLQREVVGTDAALFDRFSGEERLTASAAVAIRNRGREVKLVLSGTEQASGHADTKLVALLTKGFEARDRLMRRPEEVASSERPHATRLARLSYLAPDIIEGILDGRQPIELTARALLREAQLPLCWQAQRRQLGFASRG